MVSTDFPPLSTVDNRRLQLKRWIDVFFGGNQAAFGASTNDGKSQINQGEVSGLLKTKSFGEKRARSLEKQAHMPAGYLDSDVVPRPDMETAQHTVQEELYAPSPAVHISRPIIWPFNLVSYGRLNDLKRALGPRTGNEAIRDLDKYLDVLVAKWEREVVTRKKAATR